MTILQIASLLIVLAGAFGAINYRAADLRSDSGNGPEIFSQLPSRPHPNHDMGRAEGRDMRGTGVKPADQRMKPSNPDCDLYSRRLFYHRAGAYRRAAGAQADAATGFIVTSLKKWRRRNCAAICNC